MPGRCRVNVREPVHPEGARPARFRRPREFPQNFCGVYLCVTPARPDLARVEHARSLLQRAGAARPSLELRRDRCFEPRGQRAYGRCGLWQNGLLESPVRP